ncbi:MAG: hypothetical protein ACU0A9_18130 [Alterinioella nitratireducens]|uniref:hypothetical protein n=1 Tax=Alterinioella nitratireducens TaxID=2735915 RepID=UPI0040591E75
MGVFKAGLVALASLVLAGAASAQGWTVRTDFTEGWFFAGAGIEGGPISFNCADHYPGADWSYGEGGGPYDPYIIQISMNQTIGVPGEANWANNAPRNDVIFVIGNTGYQLPDVRWNEMVGEWSTQISVGDPLVTALLAGGEAQLWAEGALVGDLPAAGLSSSVAGAINFCDSHWIASGAPLPSHAAITMQTLRDRPSSGATNMEQAMLDYVTGICFGAAQVRADAIGRSDFDGDGVEDVMVHWSGVSCQQGDLANLRGGGNCGASNCLTSVFVSSAIGAGNGPYEVLALSARVASENGSDILLGVDPGTCTELGLQPACIARQRWNGAQFVTVAR